MNPQTCWVCGEAAELKLLSTCDSCGQEFHLNPYQAAGKDCGEVGLGDPDDPALEFWCTPCMDGTTAARRGLEPTRS